MAGKKATNRGRSPNSLATRFKKGARSPNPDGRPAGTPNRSSILRKVLEQFIVGDIGGQRKRIKLTEAVLLKLSQQALAGDKKAMGMVLDLWKESEEKMESEREAEYPFSEPDRTVIEEIYARMKATEG
ncbi:MAG: DUF5681 domain-containing protein [Rhizomicrobium sp.]